jgi:hypothetical protein
MSDCSRCGAAIASGRAGDLDRCFRCLAPLCAACIQAGCCGGVHSLEEWAARRRQSRGQAGWGTPDLLDLAARALAEEARLAQTWQLRTWCRSEGENLLSLAQALRQAGH